MEPIERLSDSPPLIDWRAQQDPQQAFWFLVSVDGTPVAGFTRLSGIKMEVMTLEGLSGDDYRGVMEILPIMTRFSPVTLSRGVVGDYDFMNWLLAAGASESTGPSGEELKRDIEIISVNARQEPVVTWTLVNAFPISYELSPMDANRSEVLMENITFASTGLVRKKGPEPPFHAPVKNGSPGLTAPKAAFPKTNGDTGRGWR